MTISRPGRHSLTAAFLSALVLIPALLIGMSAMGGDSERLERVPELRLKARPAVLRESGERLPIATAVRLAGSGAFEPLSGRMRSFGIGVRPVWLYMPVQNNTGEARTLVVRAGATWIDRLDFYAVHGDTGVQHQVAGDGAPGRQGPAAGQGYRFSHEFAPGTTGVYLRAATPDPMLVPVALLTPEQAQSRQTMSHYTYGLVYGFLVALMLYNALLYAGLHHRQHRDYSLYLGCFLLMNLAYTGHGYAWLWSDSPAIQRYAILVMMVLFAVAGLRMARSFLRLDGYTPALDRRLRLGSRAALALMALAVGLNMQVQAVFLAFTLLLLAFLIMLLLGVMGVWRQYTGARYYMLAVVSGIAGTVITTLTVWGGLPYSAAGFRAVEIGLLTEATLLALAVAYRVREHDRARERAEQLARVDALTGLLNRRALLEQGEGLLSMARRFHRQLALILVDLDHFKRINDRYGHAAGDRALVRAGAVLREVCRREDLPARWGGEEFIIVLPDTDLQQAYAVAARVRGRLAAEPLVGPEQIELRASFGIAVLAEHDSLEALIREADMWLYQAKEQGRDQICFGDPGSASGPVPVATGASGDNLDPGFGPETGASPD